MKHFLDILIKTLKELESEDKTKSQEAMISELITNYPDLLLKIYSYKGFPISERWKVLDYTELRSYEEVAINNDIILLSEFIEGLPCANGNSGLYRYKEAARIISTSKEEEVFL